MFDDPELAYAVIDMDHSIPYCIHRHPDHIVIPAVGLIDHPDGIGLDQTVVFKKGGTCSGDHLVAFGKLHRDSQVDQRKITGSKMILLCSP